ncbi:hypothetical protein FJ984_24710, partial [Mesorhizobium sp. B1-1-3]
MLPASPYETAKSDRLSSLAPPSVLPDISPSRGEIMLSSSSSRTSGVAREAPTEKPPISPLE